MADFVGFIRFADLFISHSGHCGAMKERASSRAIRKLYDISDISDFCDFMLLGR